MCLNFAAQLDSVVTIITPNRRLARHLHYQYAVQKNKEGNRAWITPNIFFIEDWLLQLWQMLNETKLLLNDFQELIAWKKILGSEYENFAPEIQKTWKLLQKWQLDPLTWQKTYLSEANLYLQQWVKSFQKMCIAQNWIDKASIINELSKIDLAKFLPERIFLAGFAELEPQLKHFFAYLENNNCNVQIITLNEKASSQVAIKCATLQEELQNMALWANTMLQHEICSIGCIIPNLHEIRDDVAYYFRKHNVSNFDISVGKSLAAYPIISDALQILSIYDETVEVDNAALFLHSPFWGGYEHEQMARALLAAEIYKRGESKIFLRTIIELARESTKKYYAPLLAENLSKILWLYKSKIKKRKALPIYWSEYFIDLLNILGWPGARALSLDEKQTVERWQNLLTQYFEIGLVTGEVNYIEALIYLKEMTQNCIFQPAAASNPPIKILGALEAVGIDLDYLWVAGLNDTVFPPLPKPNPFIPVRLQKEFEMPHATAKRELIFCEELLNSWSQSAQNVIYSYAEQGENCEYKPSRLLQNINESTITNLKLQYDAAAIQLPTLETIIDDQGPKVDTNEKTTGGSRIFKLQAMCPFRAFAECRLNGRSIEKNHFGLNSMERGRLVHRALEFIWQRLQNSQNLANCTEVQLKNIIQIAVHKSLLELSKEKIHTLQTAFIKIEEQRLQKILWNWLELEKRRQSFTVVAIEKWHQAEIAGISVCLKIDRIDALADDSLVIIDYKTGNVSVNDWFGECPNDPQLPIYYVTNDKKVTGLAFAQFRANEVKFAGISEKEINITGIQAIKDWEQLTKNWHHALQRLARDFMQGVAKIAPKNGANTCKTCDLQMLCRKN